MQRQIHKFDATGKAVGRLASEIAVILRGKNMPSYEPRIDQGNIVEVENIANLKFTGRKTEQKKYFSYSGYPGGLKTVKMSDLIAKDPGQILLKAVKQMLPPNKQREKMMKRLIIR